MRAFTDHSAHRQRHVKLGEVTAVRRELTAPSSPRLPLFTLGCSLVSDLSALSSVPPAGVSGLHRDAVLKFFYGPMDCGKSTLALQMNYNHGRQGRRGLVLTKHDRSGGPRITSRIGLGGDALE